MQDSNHLKQFNHLATFKCIGADCEDSCCSANWKIPVDQESIELYKKEAPELLSNFDLKKNVCKTGKDNACVNFQDGICSIHKNYGEKFLPETCSTYPRHITRLGEKVYISGYKSCPEITRKMFYAENPFEIREIEDNYIFSKKMKGSNNIPKELSSSQANSIFSKFFEFIQSSKLPNEELLAVVTNISFSLNNIAIEDWEDATSFLLRSYNSRPFIVSEKVDIDPYSLIFLLLFELKPDNRITEIMNYVGKKLDIEIDFTQNQININKEKIHNIKPYIEKWNKRSSQEMERILRTYITSEISCSLFPFKGFGSTAPQSAAVIVAKYGIIKLFLMCYIQEDGTLPNKEVIVKIIQTISRHLDHKANSKAFISCMTDMGWMRESRLIGLLESISGRQLSLENNELEVSAL